MEDEMEELRNSLKKAMNSPFIKEERKYLMYQEPKCFLASLPGKFVSSRELYDFLCTSQIVKDHGRIIGNEEVERYRRINRSMSDAEFVRQLQKIVFQIGQREYRIEDTFENNHRYGDSGESLSHTFLECHNHPVLVSYYYHTYDALSDDSQYETTPITKATYL